MKFRKWKSCFLVFVCWSLIGCSNNTKEEKLSEEVSDQVESKDASEISQNEGNKRDLFDSLPFCSLRPLAVVNAFFNGRYAEQNGRSCLADC